MTTVAPPTWPDGVYRLLRERGTTVFSYVPDAGHRQLIELAQADEHARAVPLTCEEEGVAISAGVSLGGGKAVLLMQSSGVGNCINFLSLISHCQLPFLTLVTMRGNWGEQNPWQYAMGQATPTVLEAMGVITLPVEEADLVEPTVNAALGMVHRAGRAVAVLLNQRLLGVKEFK